MPMELSNRCKAGQHNCQSVNCPCLCHEVERVLGQFMEHSRTKVIAADLMKLIHRAETARYQAGMRDATVSLCQQIESLCRQHRVMFDEHIQH